MNDVEKIQLQRWWMEEVRNITIRVMKDEEKRQKEAKKKAEKALADYESRDEILEAYGYNCITEKQKDKLLDLWDRANDGNGKMYESKLAMLQEIYDDAKRVLADLEGR